MSERPMAWKKSRWLRGRYSSISSVASMLSGSEGRAGAARQNERTYEFSQTAGGFDRRL
jgi:hypothetical protein